MLICGNLRSSVFCRNLYHLAQMGHRYPLIGTDLKLVRAKLAPHAEFRRGEVRDVWFRRESDDGKTFQEPQ